MSLSKNHKNLSVSRAAYLVKLLMSSQNKKNLPSYVKANTCFFIKSPKCQRTRLKKKHKEAKTQMELLFVALVFI